MKSVSNDYKEQLTALGRQYNVLVNYTVNGTNHTLSNSELNVVTPHYQGDLLKSTMKQLDLDSNVDIPIGTEINCQFGLLVGDDYEYINYGNYIVYSSEKQEDLKSYKIVCYDKMLNAMKDYQQLTTRNVFDIQNTWLLNKTSANNGMRYVLNEDNSVTISGTSTGYSGAYGRNYNETRTFYTLKANQKYRLLVNVTNKNSSVGCAVYMGTTSSNLNNAFSVRNITNNGTYYTDYTPTTDINLTQYSIIGATATNSNETNLTIKVAIYEFINNDTATTYEKFGNVTYPLNVKDYLTAIATRLNLSLATQSFVNDDVEISNEKYLDENGGNLGYTYRDVLDDLAQVTASTICINENDELEVRYITNTTGKNIFDFSKLTYDHKSSNITTFNIINDNAIYGENVGSTYSSIWFNMFEIPAGTYVLSAIANNGENIQGKVGIGIESYPTGSTTRDHWNEIWFDATERANNTRKSVAFTIDNEHYYKTRVFINQAIGDNKTTISNIMLEKNNTMSEYQPAGFTINEAYLKDTNVNFKEKYGPINSVVFSRSGDSDLIYRKDDESIEENGLCELKIKDNQLLNDNDRDNFIDEIFNKVKGLEFYINDYVSTGLTILELCDKYNVKVGENIYPCIMLNDELNVTQGFDETIHTDKPDTSESDYKKADTTDRRINQAYLIVDKQNQQITALTSRTNNLATQVNNDKQELLNKFGDYATNSQVQSLTTQVSNIQTDTYTKTEVSQILKGTFYDENNNQVVSEVVKTISGTFDENGMTYAKTNAKTSTTINEIGVRVNNTTSSAELLFAGYDDSISQTIVRTDNLLVRNFLNIGSNSRLQDYETGTGVFDI